MIKKDLTKTFFDEIYSSPPKKKFSTSKIVYNHNDEIWSIDLANFSDYKISNNKGYRYTFVKIDNISIIENICRLYLLKIKTHRQKTQEISNILSKLKRQPLKIKSGRGVEF